ncbi:MAG: hypothetical protein KDE35_15140 [Geminicoccaceae bacterium]|nr:hypothetical protein [Geminicoccaceae bacterium]
MTKLFSRLSLLVLAGSMTALAGCSNKAEMDQMRSEIASVRSIAEAADQKATTALEEAQAASAAADQAAEEARVASEKADRIFRANLRK